MRLGSLPAIFLALAMAATSTGVRADETAKDRLPLVYRGMMGDNAVIEDLETATQEVLRVGGTMRGARVVDIKPAELVLDHGGKRVTLAMGDEDFARAQLAGGGEVPVCPWLVPAWAAELDRIYATAIVDLDFHQASIDDVVGFLRTFTGTSMLVDPAAQAAGKGPFSFTLKGATIRQALSQLLPQFSLELIYRDKVAVVTTADKAAADPVRKAFQAQLGLAEARRVLDRLPAGGAAPTAVDAAVRERLGKRIQARFEGATFAEVADFLHQAAGLNVVLETDPAQAASEENLVTMVVTDRPVREFLDDLTRSHELGWFVREGFLVVTSSAALEAREEKKTAEEEAATARADQDAAVLEKALSLSFDAEPLYRVAARVTEATGVPVVIDPDLWGPTPTMTFSGGKTLQDFCEALEKNNELRFLALRGTVYVLP